MTSDSAALERALSAIQIRSGQARFTTLPPGALAWPGNGAMMFTYVISGEVTVPSLRAACALDPADESIASVSGARTLIAGDAFLCTEAMKEPLTSTSGALLVTADLDVSWPVTVARPPAVVYVKDFAAHEPAAADLALRIAPPHPEADAARSGDLVICRMMMATVVLSFIRAWSASGCAPPSWPGAHGDVFLDRVVQAVANDPGSAWTLDELASVGAMSRTVLVERFREVLGVTPGAFVTDTRMLRARAMLEEGRSVSETSRALGYASDEGFSRAFRRHSGVIPSRWREHVRSRALGGIGA